MSEPLARSSPLLLFRQVCLLAWVAGILAGREPLPGAALLVLLLLCDLPRSGRSGRMALLAVCCAAGFLYAQARAVAPPPMPPWLREATSLISLEDGREVRPPPVRVAARVRQIAFLPENRLRLFLEDMVPAGDSGACAYAGKAIWTWQEPAFLPAPGARLEATLRLIPIRDMANPGTWSAEDHWRDQGVFLRAWSQGDGARVRVLPEPSPSFFTRLHEDLRRSFLNATRAADGLGGPLAWLRRNQAAGESSARPGGSPDSGGEASLSQGAAILPALIFGDRSFLRQESVDLFAKATLAHSLALSGLHLGYAAALGFVLARAAGRIFPRLSLVLPRQRLGMLMALIPASAYLWLGQAPVSLARAWLMLLFWTLFLHRPGVLLDGLLAAVGVLLLLDPAALFSLSLQLSALSVAVIALALPVTERLTAALVRGQGRGPVLARLGLNILLLSLCIQTALAPLTIRTFGVLALWFPLNLLWLPLLGAWVMPLAFCGLFIAGLGLEGAAALVLHAAALPGEALFSLLEAMDSRNLLYAPAALRPHWLSTAGFWLICLALPAALLERARRRAVHQTCGPDRPASPDPRRFILLAGLGLTLLAAPLALAWLENRETRVSLRVLDVGQSQAVLVEWSGLAADGRKGAESGRILIDGGGFFSSSADPGRNIVAPVLTDNALPRLDAVINTHPDTDHLAGLLYILEHFQVKGFAAGSGSPPPALASRLRRVVAGRGLRPRELRAGDRLNLGPDLALEVLWPPDGQAGRKSSNNASLVLRLIWQGSPLALICGDAEIPALRGLLRRKADLRAAVLVLPHHGSRSSLIPDFYAAARPRVALVSCGYGNQWGFPAPEVRKALAACGIPLFSTAEFGQLRATWRTPGEEPGLSAARDLPF
ncbi:MAG: ComEC/Rec2 family competence protein [Desulfovibrio sp.]|jgi:competence protein ComEC|nr:ComEC/Rec2 family competence protein [Desulfovibrio sp.]